MEKSAMYVPKLPGNVLDPDAISPTGINIATGVCLENMILNGTWSNHKVWFINVYTYVRNFISCLPGNVKKKEEFLSLETNIDKMVKQMSNELDIIYNSFPNNADFEVIFYRPKYSVLKKKIPNYREPKTFRGFKKVVLEISDHIINKLESKRQENFYKIELKLPYYENAVITTHIGLDLLAYAYDKKALALESHTGEFKDYSRWYTKYHKLGSKDLSIIPFNEILYYIFGDNYYVDPHVVKTREWVYEIALKKKWNFNTSEALVISHLKLADPVAWRSYVKKIKKTFSTIKY